MDVIRYPYKPCLCTFWHCHPYFILQFYSIVFYTCIIIIICILYPIAAYPPPDGIHLARVDNGTLIFEWNPINSACAVVQYDVLSNCGSCHGNNNLTNVSCSNLRLSTNLSSCSFALRSSVCGNIFGNPSDPIMITLRGKSM